LGLPRLLLKALRAGLMVFPSGSAGAIFSNLFFLFMLIRSGLSILMDHPRLYWNDHCTPGTEWIRFTPLEVPKDRMWTAKDDARYLSPAGLDPGLPPYGGDCTLMALHYGSTVLF